MGAAGGMGFSGGGHVGGRAGHLREIGELYGYEEGWMAATKKTIEDELKWRGIEPKVIEEVVSKVEEPSHASPVIIAILATALICTLIFVAIWEATP